MKIYRRIVLPFVLAIAILSCKKDPLVQPEILSFKIEAAKNSDFSTNNIDAKIIGDSIIISLPQGIVTNNIVPTFLISNASKLYFGNTLLETGLTSLSIFNKMSLVLKGDNGVVRPYYVYIKEYQDDKLNLTITLKKAKNASLKNDVIFSNKNDTLLADVNSNFRIFVPTLEFSSEKLMINTTLLQGEVPEIDFSKPVTFTVFSNGFVKKYVIKINWITLLPQIYINTTGGVAITSKDDYVIATYRIEGNDMYKDYSGTTSIKGRGNSTWSFPKKPYRLKLDTKADLCGMTADKDWVLLANYMDGTLMLNAVAMKIAKLLNMPYTNTMIPVDVTLNGTYLGNYMLTEQIEVEDYRVNIGNGQLLELDTYFDEPWEFKSAVYQLPVMVKAPKITDVAQLNPIQTEFNNFEALVNSSTFPNNNYLNYFDADAYANFFIVNFLTDNEELNHPKSTYMYKAVGGKYTMGPIWDYDWAYGYEESQVYFKNYNRPLFWTNRNPLSAGTMFFYRIFSDPVIKNAIKQKWAAFKSNSQTVQNFITDYADLIKDSQVRDYAIWRTGSGSFNTDIQKLKAWMGNRFIYADSFISGL